MAEGSLGSTALQGIRFPSVAADDVARFRALLRDLGLDAHVQEGTCQDDGQPMVCFTARPVFQQRHAPGLDTTSLHQQLGLAPAADLHDLQREILLAMLLSPVPFSYPSFDELRSALNIRAHVARNAARTALAFDTEHAERPTGFWNYHTETGFTLKPGQSLIAALQETTQPADGARYSFSCYRATEYVLLLSIAQELAACNPNLYDQLTRQWRVRAIMSGQFHDVFLHEYGSMAQPLPPRYYIPGDRLWFRNPDQASSDAEGYEGSWVLYLGQGLFTNFWKQDQPYTIEDKCLELFHWRHGTYRGQDGKLRVDDDEVDRRVAVSRQSPAEVDAIVARMLRWRDPSGVYADGGCIDTTRECTRRVYPGTAQLVFPDAG